MRKKGGSNSSAMCYWYDETKKDLCFSEKERNFTDMITFTEVPVSKKDKVVAIKCGNSETPICFSIDPDSDGSSESAAVIGLVGWIVSDYETTKKVKTDLHFGDLSGVYRQILEKCKQLIENEAYSITYRNFNVFQVNTALSIKSYYGENSKTFQLYQTIVEILKEPNNSALLISKNPTPQVRPNDTIPQQARPGRMQPMQTQRPNSPMDFNNAAEKAARATSEAARKERTRRQEQWRRLPSPNNS